jgi:uncharacterized protein (DUF2249 family)
MNGTKTIDVKGLEHTEKGELIFPSVQKLTDSEVLRIILEFNPLPLVYILKTQGEFEILYEKEGPEEWGEVKKECDKIGYCCFTPQPNRR